MKKTKDNSRMESDKLKSIALITVPVIFWGLSFISTKIVLAEMPPVSIAFFRQIIAIVPLVILLLITKESFKITARDFLVLAVSCFFGIVLYFVCENTGLGYTTASNASVIVAALPVFTLIAEAAFFNLKINVRTVAYILASIAGVYLVISINGRIDFSSSAFLGNILIIGAMLSWVIYTILSRGLGTKYSTLLITAYQTAISTFLFIPFMVHEYREWKPLSLVSLLNLLFLGVFCSAAAYFCYLQAIRKLSATISAAFLNIIPVVTVIAGYFILSEKLSLPQIAGMAVVIGSVYKLSVK